MSKCIRGDFLTDDRYLSAPDGPLVINPFPFETVSGATKQADHYDRPSLPLNIGRCVPRPLGGVGDTWENACVLYEEARGLPEGEDRVLWQADMADPALWSERDGIYTLEFGSGELVLSNLPERGCYSHEIKIDTVFCDPKWTVLEVDVRYLAPESRVAVSVTDGKQRHCLACVWNAGIHAFFLGDWWMTDSEKVTVCLRVYEGERGACRLGGLRLLETPAAYRGAQTLSRRWHPAALETEATYPGGSRATVTDYLADGETVVRQIALQPSRALWAAGRCDAAVWDGTTLRLFSGQQKAALELPAGVPVYFYDSVLSFFRGTGTSIPTTKTRMWAVRLPTERAEYTLRFHCGDGVKATDDGPRFAYWREWLDKVPPVDFDKLADVAEPTYLRRAYDTAWAQIVADILPAQEGQRRCVTTGKASLWGYGDKGSPYAASWETFYGLMLLVYLEPRMAWEMYAEYMQQVREDGNLGGESLPSVKARTAWKLYRLFPDRERLTEVRPALERYLNWRLRNLRWIYLNRTPREDEKDMDFVASALADMQYYVAICEELDDGDAAQVWRDRSEELYRSFTEWFFPADGLPVQKYYSDDGARVAGFPLVITKALSLAILKPAEREKVLELFFQNYDPQKPFGGFRGVKLENMYDTIRGLRMSGCEAQARALAACSVRDILASGFFAEVYAESAAAAIPEGVRPAVFGCALLIWCVWFLSER